MSPFSALLRCQSICKKAFQNIVRKLPFVFRGVLERVEHKVRSPSPFFACGTPEPTLFWRKCKNRYVQGVSSHSHARVCRRSQSRDIKWDVGHACLFYVYCFDALVWHVFQQIARIVPYTCRKDSSTRLPRWRLSLCLWYQGVHFFRKEPWSCRLPCGMIGPPSRNV